MTLLRNDNDSFKELFESGKKYYDEKHYKEALRAFKKASFINRKSLDVWMRIGRCYRQMSEYKNAVKAFNKGLAIAPCNSELIYGKLAALYESKDFTTAAIVLEQLSEDEKNQKIQDLENKIKIALGDSSESSISAENAIKALTDKALEQLTTYKVFTDSSMLYSTDSAYSEDTSYPGKLLEYSKRYYSSFDIATICGKAVILGFFGTICIESLKEKKCDTVFDNLSNNFDMSNIEEEGYRALGCKSEKDKDSIWNKLYPYVQFTGSIFKQSDYSEDVVLDAIESAIVLGFWAYKDVQAS